MHPDLRHQAPGRVTPSKSTDCPVRGWVTCRRARVAFRAVLAPSPPPSARGPRSASSAARTGRCRPRGRSVAGSPSGRWSRSPEDPGRACRGARRHARAGRADPRGCRCDRSDDRPEIAMPAQRQPLRHLDRPGRRRPGREPGPRRDDPGRRSERERMGRHPVSWRVAHQRKTRHGPAERGLALG